MESVEIVIEEVYGHPIQRSSSDPTTGRSLKYLAQLIYTIALYKIQKCYFYNFDIYSSFI